jgi:hypothetical protein
MCEVDPCYEKERRWIRVAGRPRSVVLVCEECGERVVLLGSLSAWRSEGAVFECGCGKDLTLADRRDEKTTDLAPVPDAQKPAPHH